MKLAEYNMRRTLAPTLLVAYIVIAILAKPEGRAELFPFFNWSLFSTSSNPRTDVVVIVRSIDGEILPGKKYFYDLTDSFETARRRDSRFGKALDLLAQAKVHSKPNEHRLRRSIESNFMSEAEHLEYDLVQLVFDPIDRLSTGKIIRKNKIATYEKGNYEDR